MKLQIPKKFQHRAIIGIYFLGFLFFFLRFGVNGTMAGHTDGWAYVSYFESYADQIESLFTNGQVGESMYPAGPVYRYGDPCILGAFLYLPFRWLGAGVVLSWSIMLTLVYTFNAWASFLFFRQWFNDQTIGFWGGLAFSTAGFLWGNVDSPNAFYFGTLFLSLYYSLRFFESEQWQHLLLTVLFGAATIYFSSYVFVFQVLVLAILWAFRLKTIVQVQQVIIKMSVAVGVATLLVLPHLYFIANADGMLNMWNPVRAYDVLRALSMDLSDVVRPVNGNLIYNMRQDYLTDHAFFYPQHAAWAGILLWLLAIGGVVVSWRRSLVWLVIFLAGFIVAIGPELRIGSNFIPMPMMVFYKTFGLDMAIRNPVRFWYVCLIGMIGLSSITVLWLKQRIGWQILLIAGVIYVLENVPFKIPQYNARQYVTPDEAYLELLKSQNHAVVVELPSSIYTYDIDFPYGLNEYQREHIYQYWQTLHRQNIVNGSNAFIPPARLRTRELINELTEDGSLSTLINDFNINFLVFHKDLPLPQDDPNLEAFLRNNGQLSKVLETETTIVFKTTN